MWSWIVKGREAWTSTNTASSQGCFGRRVLRRLRAAGSIVRAMRFLPGGVASLARTITTSSGETINVPLNLTHGTAAWIAESGTYTPSDETITNGSLSAFKAGTKIIVSEELLTDSEFDLKPFISTEFGERIGALAGAAFISGDGSGKPTGITDAASAVSAATLAAGQVTTTTWAAIAGAIYAVPPQYRANMSFLVSDSLFVRLATLVDSTGAPLWTPSAAAGAPDRFNGIPDLRAPEPRRDRRQQQVGHRRRLLEGLHHPTRQRRVHAEAERVSRSDSGQVGFRAYTRMDGKVLLADALRVVTFAAT